MAQCPHCGEEVAGIPEICPSCGKRWSAPDAAIPQFLVQPGKYLRDGWELFKQNPGGFIGFALIFFIIQGILSYFPRVGGLISLAVSAPLLAGFYVVSAKLLQRRVPKFQDFFAGFQFFLPLLLLSVISSLLIILGFIFLVLPGIYLLVCYLFASMLVIDRRLDFWPAMELSRRTVQSQWFGFFIFLLLIIIINLGGVLLLGIGLLVSGPVSACAVAAAYADVFGLQSDYSGSIPRL
ncbi:MAG: hypothetical protein AB1424_14315 [Thermodesulfobacteriota bacterium]